MFKTSQTDFHKIIQQYPDKALSQNESNPFWVDCTIWMPELKLGKKTLISYGLILHNISLMFPFKAILQNYRLHNVDARAKNEKKRLVNNFDEPVDKLLPSEFCITVTESSFIEDQMIAFYSVGFFHSSVWLVEHHTFTDLLFKMKLYWDYNVQENCELKITTPVYFLCPWNE